MPICDPDQSDSANLDNVVELLYLAGRSLPHAIMMLVPEAWQDNDQMPDYKKAFYEYHDCLFEPWDGPASICFTDGKIVGATLDRNGLRPSRYVLTSDNKLVMSQKQEHCL
jgi:glutamate synthase (NADPH/NADH) large chain